MKRAEPNITSIPPGATFIPTLVEALLEGQLVAGFAPRDNPLALASATIWVPTRRAVRSLTSEFVSQFDGVATILPTIRALGEADDDELTFTNGGYPDVPSTKATINPIERQLILSRLVFAWAESLNPEQKALFGGADIVIPSSLGDAVRFAADLAQLMDTVATEEADWKSLNDLVPLDHAQWWQLTLEFLKIATSVWPNILLERGLQDVSVSRTRNLRAYADLYESKGSNGPVIAAGSTGSIPATAHLLKVISHMDNGAVVLPGLDRDMEDEVWAKIDLPDNDQNDDGTAPGHPQYGLKRLLNHLGTDRSMAAIPNLPANFSDKSPILRIREQIVSEALRPSHSTGHWQDFSNRLMDNQRQQALERVSLIEAKGEREEALAIALALRETLNGEGKTAALVTPDRNLARRVSAEMRRFGIDVDDSGGQPLRNTSEGRFVRLLLKVAYEEPDPIALISLLKHPNSLFGGNAFKARHAARLFELAMLRGSISMPIAGEYHARFTEIHNKVVSLKGRNHRSLKRFSPEDWSDLNWLVQRLDSIFAEFELPSEISSTASFNTLIRETISTLEQVAQNQQGDLTELYGTDNGKELARTLTELLGVDPQLTIERGEWPNIFDALIAQIVARPVGKTHARVSILGPLEARLQSFDRVVLGGLNENSWPATARNDPFLSRPMKQAIGLPTPERRTGLAAHDFQMMMGTSDVVLTRSLKSNDAPSVASRWVQRLLIVAGEHACENMRTRGQVFLDWARQMDTGEQPAAPVNQPRPIPPVDVRPTGLSITEIETWIEDPYAIYAKHILKLDALEPLLREADARERGTLYHDILEEFVSTVPSIDDDDALEQLLNIAEHHFNTANIPREYAALWWPRFKTIASNFLIWHRQHKPLTRSIHVELSGKTDDGLDGFYLRGRADRIDRLDDGSLVLFDYKTGNYPSAQHVRDAKAPQLSLEAAMAVRGAFGDELKGEASALGYIRLRPDDELQVDFIGDDADKKADAAQLGEDAWNRLASLVQTYRKPDKDYRSKAKGESNKSWTSDYDHLARVKEWAVAEDGDEA